MNRPKLVIMDHGGQDIFTVNPRTVESYREFSVKLIADLLAHGVQEAVLLQYAKNAGLTLAEITKLFG